MATNQTGNRPRWRLPLLVSLIALMLASLLWLVQFTPEEVLGVVGLTVFAAACGAGIAFLTDLSPRLKTSLGVFGAIAALVIGLVSVLPGDETGPGFLAGEGPVPSKASASSDDGPSSAGGNGKGAASESPTASTTPTAQESPLIVSVGDGFDDPECELFAVQDVGDLPERDDFGPTWVWEHDGGNAYNPTILTVEGPKDRAVIITSIDVIDMKRIRRESTAAQVGKCGPSGGALGYRSFGIDFSGKDSTTKLVAQKNEEGDVTNFPFKVSATDPELFQIWIKPDGPSCICSYRLKLNWKSEGKTGSVIIEREDELPFRYASDRDMPGFEWMSDGSMTPWN